MRELTKEINAKVTEHINAANKVTDALEEFKKNQNELMKNHLNQFLEFTQTVKKTFIDKKFEEAEEIPPDENVPGDGNDNDPPPDGNGVNPGGGGGGGP